MKYKILFAIKITLSEWSENAWSKLTVFIKKTSDIN